MRNYCMDYVYIRPGIYLMYLRELPLHTVGSGDHPLVRNYHASTGVGSTILQSENRYNMMFEH